jgi:hypothetical protein
MLLAAALLTSPAAGEVVYSEFYVSEATGSDATGEGTIASPWASINYAVTEISGDSIGSATIRVAGAVYSEKVDLPGSISVVGGYDPDTWVRNPEAQRTYVLKFSCIGDSVIDGFALVGRLENIDRGLVCSGTASVQVRNCEISLHAAPRGLLIGYLHRLLDS